MLRLLAIGSLVTSALAADVHAQAPGEVAIVTPAPEEDAPRSYRRQLILADSIAVGVVGAAVAAGTWMFEPDDFHLPMMVGVLGFTSYVSTAPVIHFAHGRVLRGFASGGARILFPAVAAVTLQMALGYEDDDSSDGATAAFAGGFAIGAVAAIAFDWFVLTPGDAPARPAPGVAPTISASDKHVFVGVGGSL